MCYLKKNTFKKSRLVNFRRGEGWTCTLITFRRAGQTWVNIEGKWVDPPILKSFVSDIAVFVLKRDVKLQPTDQPSKNPKYATAAFSVFGCLSARPPSHAGSFYCLYRSRHRLCSTLSVRFCHSSDHCSFHGVLCNYASVTNGRDVCLFVYSKRWRRRILQAYSNTTAWTSVIICIV